LGTLWEGITMATQIRVIAWLQLVFGVFLIVFALFGSVMFLRLGYPVGIIRVVTSVILFYEIALGILGIVAGVGLLRMSVRSRILGIIVSALYIFSFNPLFIAIGIYGAVILSSRESALLFQLSAPASPSSWRKSMGLLPRPRLLSLCLTCTVRPVRRLR
jgi:hypothetical protein